MLCEAYCSRSVVVAGAAGRQRLRGRGPCPLREEHLERFAARVLAVIACGACGSARGSRGGHHGPAALVGQRELPGRHAPGRRVDPHRPARPAHRRWRDRSRPGPAAPGTTSLNRPVAAGPRRPGCRQREASPPAASTGPCNRRSAGPGSRGGCAARWPPCRTRPRVADLRANRRQQAPPRSSRRSVSSPTARGPSAGPCPVQLRLDRRGVAGRHVGPRLARRKHDLRPAQCSAGM